MMLIFRPLDVGQLEISYMCLSVSSFKKMLVGVLDFRLREYEYLAKTYTIADMAALAWIARHEAYGISLDDFVGVRNWYNRLSKRPAVLRGNAVPPPITS